MTTEPLYPAGTVLIICARNCSAATCIKGMCSYLQDSSAGVITTGASELHRPAIAPEEFPVAVPVDRRREKYYWKSRLDRIGRRGR